VHLTLVVQLDSPQWFPVALCPLLTSELQSVSLRRYSVALTQEKVMSRIAYVIIFSLLATGCGARIDAGNAEGVTVSGLVATDAEALQLADQHCGKYGKSARIQQTSDPQSGRRNWNYICVRPSS
jgi:hypothetical protein